jgi:hypothetical protein
MKNDKIIFAANDAQKNRYVGGEVAGDNRFFINGFNNALLLAKETADRSGIILRHQYH